MSLNKIKRNIRLIWSILRGKRHPFVDFKASAEHYRKGHLIWAGKNLSAWWNGLMDGGENNMLDVYYRGQNVPATFYLGLGNNGGTVGIPAEDSTLATITEVTGDGYNRQEITRDSTGWPDLIKDTDGDWYVTSKKVAFTNSGTSDWTSADYLFITDAASGTTGNLIATIALNASRVLKPSDELDARVQKAKAS